MKRFCVILCVLMSLFVAAASAPTGKTNEMIEKLESWRRGEYSPSEQEAVEMLKFMNTPEYIQYEKENRGKIFRINPMANVQNVFNDEAALAGFGTSRWDKYMVYNGESREELDRRRAINRQAWIEETLLPCIGVGVVVFIVVVIAVSRYKKKERAFSDRDNAAQEMF